MRIKLLRLFLGCWWHIRTLLWPEDWDEISQGIYQGGAIRRKPWFIWKVLNLQAEHDDWFWANWMPIDDLDFPGIEWLDRAANFVAGCHILGQSVLVHCMEGHSRSGMVVIAAHMKICRWSLADALTYVQSKRPGTQPNPKFMIGLAEYEKHLEAQRAA